jgi:hypothetical protein
MDAEPLFGDKLQEALNPILLNVDFRLIRREMDKPELLVYKRKTPYGPRDDQVEFFGSEVGGHIYVLAASGKKHVDLTTLKLLLPNFAALSRSEKERWTYTSEEELDTCIGEIVKLVDEQLLSWFDDPVIIRTDTQYEYDSEPLREHLVRGAEYHEKIAEQLRSQGRISEAERHEWTAKKYRKQTY